MDALKNTPEMPREGTGAFAGMDYSQFEGFDDGEYFDDDEVYNYGGCRTVMVSVAFFGAAVLLGLAVGVFLGLKFFVN
ncbi:hypothetical protein FWF93_02885 [Candidatus Saccharibacteria bacterium]|nr:hypothetical protein [Candidatus Saccharibacteria bacterium]